MLLFGDFCVCYYRKSDYLIIEIFVMVEKKYNVKLLRLC